MNIFKSLTLKWWPAGLFKVALIALGIGLGVTWPQLFTSWLAVIWLLFLVPAIYITYIWWKQ